MGEEVLSREGLPPYLSDYNFDDEYRVPLMTTPPTIDGFVDEDEWRCSAGFDGLSYEGVLVERRAKCYVGATKTHLYFAVVSEMPPDGELVSNVTAHTNRIVGDDTIEVWINPNPGEDISVTYQLLANAIGYDAYQTHVLGNVPTEEWYGWNGNYRMANGFHDGYWHIEIEVPIEKVSKGRSATEGIWGINICRNFKQVWEFACLGNRSYNPMKDIVFKFVENHAAAIQMKQFTDPFTRNIDTVLSIYNPGQDELDLKAHLFLKRNLMPEWVSDDEFVLAPGETKEVRLQIGDLVSNRFALFALVRENDGPVHYSRHFAWGPPKENRWSIQQLDVIPVDFRFAYWPYLNKMRVEADISGLKPEAKLSSIEFTIRPKGGGETIKSFEFAASDFDGTTYDVTFDMPPLSGDYEIIAQPRGEGVPEEPVVKEFIRYVYEWEHLGLGKSRKVYAPFTPIEVKGNTLCTVMKEYDINGCGLLDSVRTLDQARIGMKDVLAAPMTYTANIGGKEVSPEGCGVRITIAEEDKAVAESSCKLADVELNTVSTLDYDGMLRVDVTLSSSVPTDIESLDLEIPIHGEVGKMMHAMVDGLRYPIFTSTVPEGTGTVWTASELITSGWPPNFCTYIFVGNAVRGLCWFAENDKGWSWDPEKPNLDLVRGEDGTLTMRVHLVSKPLTLDAPRTITFGLQGAPVKPRLEGWRHKWYTDNYSILGCDRHWFAEAICGSVYPAGKDMHLWEMIKRGNTERLSDEEIEEFVKYGSKYFEPHGWEGHLEEFVTLARRNLRNRYGTTMIFYYNRSSSTLYDEFHTFIDEWVGRDFNNRTMRVPYEYGVFPTESYIDYALYWYGKSFDVAGNTGVYVDNNYFSSSFNRTMSGAYTKPDGTIMQSTGIWNLRELAKRTFVYMNERGMLPINMNHMSTTQILPINAFYTVQYDWEWHFSEGDVQTRYSREYIQLVSNGEHSGTWPVVLHDNGKLREDPWTQKTFQGVCTVHELITDRYYWHEKPVEPGDTPENRLFHRLRGPISEICRQPDVDVFRYWDERPQPVVANDDDLPTIVFSRKGKEAIVALTSYANKDEDAVLTIDAGALGFESGGYTAVDMESGEEVPVDGDRISFLMKKHDLKQFRLTPK